MSASLVEAPVTTDQSASGYVRDRLLASCHYSDMAEYADLLAEEIAERDGDTPQAVALFRLASRLRSLAQDAGGVPRPDTYAVGAVRLWKCANCVSTWLQVSPSRAPQVVRLLHHDETCPCFGLHCECGKGVRDD